MASSDHDLAIIQAAIIQAGAQQAAAEINSGAQISATTLQTETQLNISKSSLTSQEKISTAEFANRIAVAEINARGNRDVTEKDAQSRLAVAQLDATSRTATAASDAASRQAIAAADAASRTAIAAADAASRQAISTAEIASRGDISGKEIASRTAIAAADAASRTAVAQSDADSRTSVAQSDAASRTTVGAAQAAATVAAAQVGVAVATLHEQGENTRLETKLNFADGKFKIAYELAQKGIAQAGDGSAGTTLGLLALETAPYVNTRGVFTPAQVQQQVNAAYARNDSRTNNQIRQAQGDLAGRGFSSNSPLLDALKVGYVGQNLRANAESASQVRLQAASANADQVTKGQSLAVNEWQIKQNVVLDSEKNQITRQVGILGAIAQMVGSVG